MKIKRKPVMAARDYNDDTVFVIFRKVRVDGQWIPCAFWYSSGQTLNYGRLYVIEPEFGGYICEEADMGYYNTSKKLTPTDPGYDDLKAYTYDYLTDHGDGQGGFKKIVERQKVDYNALRNSWYRDTIPGDDMVEYSVNSSTRSRKRPVTAARKINFLITVTDTDEIIDVLDDQDAAIEVARQYTQKCGNSTTVEKQYIGSDGETFDSAVVYQTDADAYSSTRLSGRKRVMADFQLSDDETWKWVDFGNDILREAIRQGITLQDFDCECDNPAALEIHCNVYVMSTYEFTLNINNVGGYILVEQSNGEDDYLQRFQCSDLNEALGTVFNLFSNAVKFGKWSAVNSSTIARKRPVEAASEFGSESLRHMNDYDEKYGNSPAKRMAMLFPYFLQDVEYYFSDVDSSWFYIKGTQFYDSNYDIDFEVIPIFDGSELPFGTVLIEYRAQESPSLAAKCQENGDIIATGDSFIDILVEVERYIEETYTEYADNLPAEYWD